MPEGIDASVPLVRDLLEGLVRLLLHYLKTRIGDELCDLATELRARVQVAAAGED